MKACDEEAWHNGPIVSPPDLWRVFLEPPVPASGQELPDENARRGPETHYGSLEELTAIAADYGAGETYVWMHKEKTYRLQA